jgi:hypothetical protein
MFHVKRRFPDVDSGLADDKVGRVGGAACRAYG